MVQLENYLSVNLMWEHIVMHCMKKPPLARWYDKAWCSFCIFVFIFMYMILAPQVSAQSIGMPGGQISNLTVRQVDIARPAVVRIITSISGQLTVHFPSTSQPVTFPLDNSSYSLELSGTGAFISAHGDILTADHVVNPPHDRALDEALYQTAAPDIADYVNAHFQTSQPFSAADIVSELVTGAFVSTPTYGQQSSQVYLSTAYTGSVSATKFENVPAGERATVDRIEAQSSFDAMDVAIIHVNGMDNMPSIQLGDSNQVEEQDTLTIIGYPGLADVSTSPSNLLTSSINKIYVSAKKTTDNGAPVIEVAGNVEHGDSGAPALDENGNVVGIVSFSVYHPNENGQTSFLQASNSAETLIRSQGIDTVPGSLEKAWSQALKDYASRTPGHWHTAERELQSLVSTYANFQGAAPYLTYAQSQARAEQLPAVSSNMISLLMVVLLLFGLVILGGVIFLLMKRHRSIGYGINQLAVSSSPHVYQQQKGLSPAYTPVSTSSLNFAGPASASGNYSYTPDSQVPQTPYPLINQMPVSATLSTFVPGTQGASVPSLSQAVEEAQPLEVSAGTLVERSANLYEHSLPTWEVPTSAPVDWPAKAVQPELVSGSLSATGEKSASSVPMVKQEKVARVTHREADAASPPEVAPAMGILEVQENRTPVPPASGRNFSVPKRPLTSTSESLSEREIMAASNFAALPAWVAPCGHANIPDVRFCRVCGKPITAAASSIVVDNETLSI